MLARPYLSIVGCVTKIKKTADITTSVHPLYVVYLHCMQGQTSVIHTHTHPSMHILDETLAKVREQLQEPSVQQDYCRLFPVKTTAEGEGTGYI